MAPSAFIVPEHVVVPDRTIPLLLRLIELGHTRARDCGLLQGPGGSDLVDLLAALRSRRPTAVATGAALAPTDDDVWLSTKDAASVLGVGDRQMLNFVSTITNAKHGQPRVWLEAEVLAERDARERFGTDRKSSASDASAA